MAIGLASGRFYYADPQAIAFEMLNNDDKAFQQIAIFGFKDGSAADRIQAVEVFAIVEVGADVHAGGSNEDKGAKKKRELTDNCFNTFIDGQVRDSAFKLLKH